LLLLQQLFIRAGSTLPQQWVFSDKLTHLPTAGAQKVLLLEPVLQGPFDEVAPDGVPLIDRGSIDRVRSRKPK
jgi:hypothetical protein